MHIATLQSLCTLFAAMARFNVHGSGPPITCDAGTFTVGEHASISCNFRVQITTTERPINMARYPSDAPRGAIGTDVLLCRWSTAKKKHDCFIEMANYTFDGILTDHLTVEIPAVSFEQAGLYMCFFVPSEGTDPHPCELRVQAKPERHNTDEPEESMDVLPIVLPCVIVVLAVVCIAGFILFMRRRRAKRARRPKSTRMEFLQMSKTTKPLLQEEKQKVDKLEEDFQLLHTSLQKVVNAIQQEMQKSLDSSTHRSANTGMFRTFVSPLPTASETGYVMVFQLRSNRLTIQFVMLPPPKLACPSKSFNVPKGIDTGTQTLSKAHLTKWTKEFNYKDVGRKDLHGMLQQAFKKTTLIKEVEIVAIVNDTVSSLVSAACSAPQCKVAMHVGNGFNACYVEDLNRTGASGPQVERQSEVINTVLGGILKEADLNFVRTVYDRELDEYSPDSESQIFEKMVSWMYIGEIVRLVLKRLINDGALFHSLSNDCQLFKKQVFYTEYVLMIEKETEEPFSKTQGILRCLKVENYTDEDVKIVRDVCRLVCERSAFLTAAGLAALINHIKQPEITVVVDGKLYLEHPRFHDLMYSKTLELVNPGLTFYLVSPTCDRSVGAARIAAAALRLRNTQKSKK